MNRRRHTQLNRTALAFSRLPADERRIVLEVTRRMVAGIPFDIALEAVTGHSEIPANWKS